MGPRQKGHNPTIERPEQMLAAIVLDSPVRKVFTPWSYIAVQHKVWWTGMPITIDGLYRYPVKGLNAESLAQATLVAGEPIPGDRRFAIAHGSTQFDCANPKWLDKHNFLMLAKDEKLAQLEARFDEESQSLTICRQGRQVVTGRLDDATGRTLIGQFLAGFMAGNSRGTPKIIEAKGHSFSDVPDKVLSLINLASVSDLERVLRQAVDPARFRANLYFTGLAAWHERRWCGKEVAIGEARLRIIDEIERCAATNVNPETAERDMNIPLTLRKGYGHMNMGVYAKVIRDGVVAKGDEIRLIQ
jgi:uncharacterized protein YcbX